MKIAFISAEWHSELVQIAVNACLQALVSAGYSEGQLDRFTVPGSLEIPLLAQKCTQSGRYEGVLAFGLVVDGGIYRHDFVGQAVIDGLMRVQLDSGVPVLSCVMTPHHFHEHDIHHAFFQAHLFEKGQETAKALLGFLKASAQISAS